MSVLWTNFPSFPIHRVLNIALKTLCDFAFNSCMISFSSTLFWIHHSTATFPPLCCSSDIPTTLPCGSPCLEHCLPGTDKASAPHLYQVSVQMSFYPCQACGKHNPLFSQLPHCSLHPYPALVFIMTLIRHFLFPLTRIKASWGWELGTVFL